MLSLRSIFLRQVLLCGGALVSAWQLQSRTLAPLRLRDDAFVRQRTELRDNLSTAQDKLAAIKDSEVKVGEARTALDRLLGEHRETPTLVSFPKEMVEHFSRFGYSSALVRLATAEPARELPGYQRIYWSIGLPIPKTDRNIEGLLLAMAELEQQGRLIKVIDFALQPDPEDPSRRTASINVMVLSEK